VISAKPVPFIPQINLIKTILKNFRERFEQQSKQSWFHLVNFPGFSILYVSLQSIAQTAVAGPSYPHFDEVFGQVTNMNMVF
jgi:hypothetical protein